MTTCNLEVIGILSTVNGCPHVLLPRHIRTLCPRKPLLTYRALLLLHCVELLIVIRSQHATSAAEYETLLYQFAGSLAIFAWAAGLVISPHLMLCAASIKQY